MKKKNEARFLAAFVALLILASVFAPAVIRAQAQGRKVYAVGNGEGNWLHGVVWNPSHSDNLMEEVSPNVYEIVYEDVYGSLDYQIKFTIDGSWDVNFGAPDNDDFYGFYAESGVEAEAVFNGQNIYFDVDDDGSTVTLRLDLTGYNESTHKGAKFTVTITPPDDESIIKNVVISYFEEPVGGRKVGDHDKPVVPDGAKYYISEFLWYDADSGDILHDNDVFSSGHSYYIYIIIRPIVDKIFDENANVALESKFSWTESDYVDREYLEISDNQIDLYSKNVKAVKKSNSVTGDFTGDRKVTSDDAVYLLRYTLFPEMYPLYYSYADFNHDGKITSDDAIYLLRHTLFPESFPLEENG